MSGPVRTPYVAVFCGANPGSDPVFAETATRLGEELARAGLGLVYGGGGVGMMGAVSDGVLRAGGRVTGVIPQALFDREVGRTDLDDLRVVPDMHERKALMYELSSAFVTLPGGFGTFEEFFETLTWNQLGLHAKPSYVLDVAGYYEPLRRLLDSARESGFTSDPDRELVRVVEDVEELVAELLAVTGEQPR